MNKGLSDKEHARTEAHYRWMDSLPTQPPSSMVALESAPLKINGHAYDYLPTKLGNPEKHFANIPTLLGNPREAFAHIWSGVRLTTNLPANLTKPSPSLSRRTSPADVSTLDQLRAKGVRVYGKK